MSLQFERYHDEDVMAAQGEQRNQNEHQSKDVLARDAKYWRSVEEYLSDADLSPRDDEFVAGVAQSPEEFLGDVSRRDFMSILAASVALAGVSSCRSKISADSLPYAIQPPGVVPGIPTYYATSMLHDGYAIGLVAKSNEGRPTKIEGNPLHPASLGATTAAAQASILDLYDPERGRSILHHRIPSEWGTFVTFAQHSLQATQRGSGVHFLLQPTSSPSVLALLAELQERYPEAKIHFFSPLASPHSAVASSTVLGRQLIPNVDLLRADIVVSLEYNFLCDGPFQLAMARNFGSRRRVGAASDTMLRLYSIESTMTVTGAAADHRLALSSAQLVSAVAMLLNSVMNATARVPSEVAAGIRPLLSGMGNLTPSQASWIGALAKDLLKTPGRSAVMVGERQPDYVHAMVYLLNDALGNTALANGSNVQSPVFYREPVIAADASQGLSHLEAALRQNTVRTLFVLGGNPGYTAPADFPWRELVGALDATVYLGLYENETSETCTWFVPASHFLESWGDARAFDGTISFIQPLIEPMHGGKTVSEVLAACLGYPVERTSQELLRAYWAQKALQLSLPLNEGLKRGLLPNTASPVVTPSIQWSTVQSILGRMRETSAESEKNSSNIFEISFETDYRTLDGVSLNNSWLMELPDPITKLTWDNAALFAPSTASRLGIADGDVLLLTYNGRQISAPALILPGQATSTVTLPLGYGRRGVEQVTKGRGFNAYKLRTSLRPFFDSGLEIKKSGDVYALALTQSHWDMRGRPQVLDAPKARFQSEHGERQVNTPHDSKNEATPTLRGALPTGSPQWGMSIDLSQCVGCSACVVACQAENNIPVVGKVNVLKSREMHWLRIDRYFQGPPDDPRTVMQPMLCQHCETAPCEYVCPVNATTHSPDGLNEMTYNRCVGTRFCSNNCPYKVRRFNWFDFNRDKGPLESLAMNPDVTVRQRGVMEKCTFCVQRIRKAQIHSRIDQKLIRDGELQTACQQACPTRAIVFGDLADPTSQVHRLANDPRAYGVLQEIGTRPRVRYLARLRNPNPEIEES